MAVERCRSGWLFRRAEMFCLAAKKNVIAEVGEAFFEIAQIIRLDNLHLCTLSRMRSVFFSSYHQLGDIARGNRHQRTC